MKERYLDTTFRKQTQERLDIIEAITQEYMAKGYTLTVRQIYYQLVARGHIANSQNSYKKIVDTVRNGRLAGALDWDAVEDRGRYLRSNPHWDSPRDMIYTAAQQYTIDKRSTQPVYCEAWIEKDSLISILEPVASRYDVPCFSCRGYPSITGVKDAAARYIREGRQRDACYLFYAGDFDASGLDITRDIQDRLRMFGANVTVERIALTREQIEQYNPPPAPVKTSDKRAAGFIRQYGGSCWELDALEPQVLEKLYQDRISALTDLRLFEMEQRREAEERDALNKIYRRWDYVVDVV